MNSQELRRDVSPDIIDNKMALPPEDTLGRLGKISSETETALNRRAFLLLSQIENSHLSPEKKTSYRERASQLIDRYSERARQLRDIALVALVVSAASPSFAQEKDTEKPEQMAPATLTVKQDGGMLDQINNRPDKEPSDIVTAITPENIPLDGTDTEPETGDDPNIALSQLPTPDITNSIILNALEAAAKANIEYAKENPIETGGKLASKFLKGPLKYLGDAIEVGKGIQEGEYKNDTPADTARKVSKFLLNLKTFGLGGIVIDRLEGVIDGLGGTIIDFLKAQKGKPE